MDFNDLAVLKDLGPMDSKGAIDGLQGWCEDLMKVPE